MNVVLLLVPWIVQGLHYAKKDNNYRTDMHQPSEQMALQLGWNNGKERKGVWWRRLYSEI